MEYRIVDYDNNPGLPDDHMLYSKEEMTIVQMLPEMNNLVDAAKQIVENWTISNLAIAVCKLNNAIKGVEEGLV